MIVLFWSRATRDLLKSFGWGIAALHRLHAATKLPRPRRPPHSVSRSHPLTRRQTHGSDRMNGAERDTVVGSGSLVTLDPGATKREIARSFPVRTRGHYRRREALDPQRQQRGRQASEAARHKR